MTKKYLMRAGVAAALGLAAAGVALATPIELTAVSGTGPGTSVMLPNSGGGGTVSYSNSNFNGWNIELAYGMSDSPALGLSLITATANCSIAACAPLTIAVSDIGFTSLVGPGGLGTSLTNENISTPGGTPGGSSMVTQWAYMDTGNAYFGSTDPNAAADFGGIHDGTASLIGKLMVDNLGSMYAQGGTATDGGSYSLTLVDQFCSDPAGAGGTCASGLSVQSTGGITAPEPGSLALFGAGILGLALFATRRRSLKTSV